jgi:hypothetical protein
MVRLSKVMFNDMERDESLCQRPDCAGLFEFSNVHKPKETCNMNAQSLPIGCDQPEEHHTFWTKKELKIRAILFGSDIVWPKYGSDTLDSLTERLVKAL